VKLTSTSTLPEVAVAVGAQLRRHGITAVLTGGACVSVYTDGSYVSKDLTVSFRDGWRTYGVDEQEALQFRRAQWLDWPRPCSRVSEPSMTAESGLGHWNVGSAERAQPRRLSRRSCGRKMSR
jgi:hypothetical protein